MHAVTIMLAIWLAPAALVSVVALWIIIRARSSLPSLKKSEGENRDRDAA
jgi:hypothetical protein